MMLLATECMTAGQIGRTLSNVLLCRVIEWSFRVGLDMILAGNMQKERQKLWWHLNLIICSTSMVILLRMRFNGDLQPLGCSPSSKLYTTHGYMLYVCTFTADSSLQRMKTRRNKKDPNMYIRIHMTLAKKQTPFGGWYGHHIDGTLAVHCLWFSFIDSTDSPLDSRHKWA